MEHLLVNPGFYRSVNMILCLHCVHLIYISTYVFTHVYALISGPVSNLEKSMLPCKETHITSHNMTRAWIVGFIIYLKQEILLPACAEKKQVAQSLLEQLECT